MLRRIFEQRIYILFVIVTGVIALLMSIESAASALLMLTWGAATPIIFSATIFIYLAALAPMVAKWDNDRLGGFANSAALVLFIALAPGLFAEWEVSRAAATAGARNLSGKAPHRVRSIEIRRPHIVSDGYFPDQDPCDSECHAILASGKIDWIRTVWQMPGIEATTSTVYAHFPEGACSGVTELGGLPGCTLPLQENHLPADLVVQFAPPPIADESGIVARIRPSWDVSAEVQGDGNREQIFRKASLQVEIPYSPTIIGPKFRGFHSSGIEIQKKEGKRNFVGFQETFVELGVAANKILVEAYLDASRREGFFEITPRMTAEALAILSFSGKEYFSLQDSRPIEKWVSRVGVAKEWTPRMSELAGRIAGDIRVDTPAILPSLMAGNRAAAEAMVPGLLHRMAATDDPSADRYLLDAVGGLSRLESDILRHHADGIIQIIGNNGKYANALRLSIGKIGVDPSPFLLPFEQRSAFESINRLRGACLSEDQWKSVLVPRLIRSLEANNARSGWEVNVAVEAARALVRFGEKELAHTILVGKGWDKLQLRMVFDNPERKGPC